MLSENVLLLEKFFKKKNYISHGHENGIQRASVCTLISPGVAEASSKPPCVYGGGASWT